MPGNILNADTGFPSFAEDMTSDQKIDRVMNYLYMLLEQLRYTLFNLGVDNFNGAEIGDLAKIITDPVYLRLEDEMGNLTSLQITVEGLTSRVQNAEGGVSVLQQTADSISGRVQNMEGDLAQVTLTAEGLVSRVSSAEGNISTLTQTAEGLSSRVSSAEGNISTLTQTAESISGRVQNVEGDLAQVSLKANGNGTSISQIVEAVGVDGKVSAASIVTAVNASGSSVRIKADKIEMTGTATFVSSSENSDGELEIDGNSLGIYIDGTLDNGRRDLESTNGINFYYDWSNDGKNVYKMGRMHTRIEGETDDVSSRYALCIDTMPFLNSNGDAVEAALKLMATGRGSFEAKSLYLNGYYGYVKIDGSLNTRISANQNYATLMELADAGMEEASVSGNAYCFCTDGIYYNGVKILNTKQEE